MSKKFLSEREGQINFFEDLKISTDVELTNNTDGVYKGTIFEFKLTIPDINRVLFQAIKYLSHMRLRGKAIPYHILLIALNEENAYLFNSADFLVDIEKIYAGAASKNNANFSTKIRPEKISFDNIRGLHRLTEIIEEERYTKVHIDVFDVVGWAEHYYMMNPKASKSHLFDELRNPIQFKDYIYPWKGNDIDFKYINDLLNARILKKELGAFYTPAPYCMKATELVRKAIKAIPQGNDYIILDRTAGTGNLEDYFTDKPVKDISLGELGKYVDNKFKKTYLASIKDGIDLLLSTTSSNLSELLLGDLVKYETTININDILSDNEIGHAIVNTYELKEWIVLNERLGNKVRLIIPPDVDPKNQLVSGGDALSSHFVLGSKSGSLPFPELKDYYAIIDELNSYVQNPNTNIIVYENPPYRDETSGKDGENRKKDKMTSYIKQQAKLGNAGNDLANQFIWSAKNYYLTKPNDALILFSPVKYFKSVHLDSGLSFQEGYLVNREHFHATKSSISLIYWQNKPSHKEELLLPAYDIVEGELEFIKDVTVKKVHKLFSDVFYDPDIKKDVIGYYRASSFNLDSNSVHLFTTKEDHSKELTATNYMAKLPLFAAKLFPQKNWYERDIYFTTADGGVSYQDDEDFLKACFIFACLSTRNHCLSFENEGKIFRNELCFDKDTLASKKIKDFSLTPDERELLSLFGEILARSKDTDGYIDKYSYGTYQINKDLNTRYKNEVNEWVYVNTELNTDINTLKAKLNKYYQSIIQPKLFEYELLK